MIVCERIPALGSTCMTAAPGEDQIDISLVNAELRYDVSKYQVVVVQAVRRGTTAWSSGVLTLYRSLDGVNAFALETPDTVGPGDDISLSYDPGATSHLIVRVTTAEASVKAAVIVKGKRTV